MKHNLIKHRDRLLKDLDEYDLDPSQKIPLIEVILEMNKEIRLLDFQEERNKKKEDEKSLFPDLN